MKKISQKKVIIGIFMIIVLMGIGIGAVLTLKAQKKDGNEIVSKESEAKKGNLTVGVTESGSVTIGTLEQSFSVDLSSISSTSNSGNNGSSNMPQSSSNASSLVVEEVYASVGQVAKQGDPLLKITKESMQEIKEKLESEVKSAQLSLKEAKIQRDNKKLQAKHEYEANIALGKTAKTEYETTLASLSNEVTKAQKELKEAKSRISSIPSEISTLKKKKAQLTEEQEKQSIEKEIEELTKELENYQNNYSSLTTKVSEAKSRQITEKISAKKKYEEAKINYASAQELYDIVMESVGDEVDSAKEALETAEDTLKEWKEFIGNGTILATYDGTILSFGYKEGDSLSTDTAIASYADMTGINVTVSVSQEDISTVEVGNEVNIIFTAYPDETYEGQVTGITTSESKSSTVSYDVIVNVSGAVEKLYEGMTGDVTFVTKEVKDVLYVSNKAIKRDGTKSYVTKKDGENTTKVEVTTGFSDGVNVEIREGLQEGDVVLIESQVSGS